ncbi:unnamed protein product [Owenia fusiformis]|uniref:Uncharacterized protein n=1 Tax=Owenia fusiformis TaxID=6347 RepID=A0A8J1UTL1_OWEFU|nr:unnamed protein product [Owenia fusiformis]
MDCIQRKALRLLNYFSLMTLKCFYSGLILITIVCGSEHRDVELCGKTLVIDTKNNTLQLDMSDIGSNILDSNCSLFVGSRFRNMGLLINLDVQYNGETTNSCTELLITETNNEKQLFSHVICSSNLRIDRFLMSLTNNVSIKFITTEQAVNPRRNTEIKLSVTPYYQAQIPQEECSKVGYNVLCKNPIGSSLHTSICISNSFACDGIAQCSRREDEEPEVCNRVAMIQRQLSIPPTTTVVTTTTASSEDFSSIWSYTSIGVFGLLVFILLSISLSQCLKARRSQHEDEIDSNAMYQLSDGEEGQVNPGYAPPEYSLVRRQISQTPSDISLPPNYDDAVRFPISPIPDGDIADVNIVSGTIPQNNSEPTIAQEASRVSFMLGDSISPPTSPTNTTSSTTALT